MRFFFQSLKHKQSANSTCHAVIVLTTMDQAVVVEERVAVDVEDNAVEWLSEEE
jgi:hypothetical protein